MSVDTMRWAITVLIAAGFIFPAIGIAHTLLTISKKGQARERAKLLKNEIDAKYERMEAEARASS
jgi:hypothetical protein